MSRFKEIIGGTQKDAYAKFPWLKKADFENAVVNIRNEYLIWENGWWKDGVWKNGIWKNGLWENGTWEKGDWEDGVWEYGVWKNGVWENGVWENGLWKNGLWENGLWCRGTWKDGVWEKGEMWSDIKRDYIKVNSWDKEKGKFILEEDIKNKLTIELNEKLKKEITRVVVIDHRTEVMGTDYYGRVLDAFDSIPIFEIQDNGKTLKIFINDKEEENE